MDRFEELKLKYQSAINLMKAKGVRLANLHLENNKLFVKGAAPSEEIRNEVWNQIKLIDPGYADLTCDLSVDPALAPPPPTQKTYTVQKGDSLWRIAEKELGKGSLYPKIIEANPDRLKDEKSVIHPGDVLVIPQL